MNQNWRTARSHGSPPWKKVRTWVSLLAHVAARTYLGVLLGFLLWTLLPLVVGGHTSVVMSGSMMPNLRPGDAIVRTSTDPAHLKPGQIVAVDDPDRAGRLRMHRLVETRPDGSLVLRGDANARPDSTPVRPGAVRGLARLRVPYVALPALWVRTGHLGYAALWLLLTGAAVVLAASPGRPGRPDLPERPRGGGTGRRSSDSHVEPTGGPVRPWRRRSAAVAMAVPGLLIGPLGGGVALAAYSTVSANPSSTFAAAASFCATPGTTTLNATADSTVAQATATTNSGTSTTLSVSSSSSANQRTLVTFALPTTPAHCTVTAAVLTFAVSSGVAGRTLGVTPVPTSWTETGATWTNQPTVSGTAITAGSVATGSLSFAVTSQVQGMYAGSNFGFLVKDQTESSATARTQTFSSRQGATPPKLAVTFG
ncbi:MAG: signal peptidase [Nocardioidaceae bacterium]|nr:signal peptidase [Nocardioidaceae bacterium]